MKKCVRIVLGQVTPMHIFWGKLAKLFSAVNVEGIVEQEDAQTISAVVYGGLDIVNGLVGDVEEFVIRHNLKNGSEISFAVEPHFKNEDYRGIVRFVKHEHPESKSTLVAETSLVR